MDYTSKIRRCFLPLFALILALAGCNAPQLHHRDIHVNVIAGGETQEITLPAGSSVSDALLAAGISVGELDKIEPPPYALLSEGDTIRYIHVEEIFETEEEIIPFEHQVIRNESLPEGETRLMQPGENGKKEITIRRVLEDGVETARSVVKTVVVQTPVPEITMVGVQTAFAPIPIPGRIAYLAGGNAWIMEDSTANRRPLVTTGDLDGRIFSLSPDGKWLLYTRKSDKPPSEEINTLWVVSVDGKPEKPINLKVSNVVHYAGWRPNSGWRVYFSTVEPRATAPGWQANNDLYQVTFGPGWASSAHEIVEANSGGVYGWWGISFTWSPNGLKLAYARPDSVGLVNIKEGTFEPLLDILPLQTHSDWAWIPGITWGADTRTLFTVTHAPPPSLVAPEESPYFDLSAVSLVNDTNVNIVQQSGMFAYPAASRLVVSGQEQMYQIAYLQAIFPAQSENSRYRLVVMDRDGSNRRALFPSGDAPGLEPQTPVWAPDAIEGQTGDFIAIAYMGNLYLIDSATGEARQITGDGLITRIDWK